MKKLIALIALLPFLGACGYEIVDTGYTGVEVRFGEVTSGALPPGIYFYNPFTSDVKEVDTQLKQWNGKIATYTQDKQVADIYFTATYALAPVKVPELYVSMATNSDKYV